MEERDKLTPPSNRAGSPTITELVLVRAGTGPGASQGPGHLYCCSGYSSGAKEVKEGSVAFHVKVTRICSEDISFHALGPHRTPQMTIPDESEFNAIGFLRVPLCQTVRPRPLFKPIPWQSKLTSSWSASPCMVQRGKAQNQRSVRVLHQLPNLGQSLDILGLVLKPRM